MEKVNFCALTTVLDFAGQIFRHCFRRWKLCTDEQLMENQSSRALLTSASKVTVEKLYMTSKEVFNTSVYPKRFNVNTDGINCTRSGRVCTVWFEGDRLHLRVRAYLL